MTIYRPPAIKTLALAAAAILALLLLALPNVATAATADDHLVVTVSPTQPAVGQDVTITATVKDASGHIDTGYSSLAFWNDTAGANGQDWVSIVGGVGHDTVQFSTPVRGDKYTVQTADLQGTSAAFTVVGPVTHFDVRVPSTAAAGAQFPFTAYARDALGSIVKNYFGAVNFPASVTYAGVPFVNGVSTGWVMVPNPAHQLLLAVTAATGSPAGSFDSNPINVIGPPDHVTGSFKRTDGLKGCASVTGTLTLKMYDSAGNVLTGYNGQTRLSDGLSQALIIPDYSAPFARGVSSTANVTADWPLGPPSSDWLRVWAYDTPTLLGQLPLC